MTTQTSVNNQFLNNLSATETVAGATALVTNSNTNNADVTSHSLVSIYTGGSSAGDAFIHFGNNVTDWVMGVDNSDSDSLVISASATPGTTNTAKCVVGGQWTYPLQPGFCAIKTGGTVANVTGNGAVYAVVQDTEVFDTSSDFSTVTGIFTTPIDGKYIFTGAGIFTDQTIGTGFFLAIITSNRTYYGAMYRPASTNNAGARAVVITDMDAGDTAYMAVIATGEAGNTEDFYALISNNHFSGVLLQ